MLMRDWSGWLFDGEIAEQARNDKIVTCNDRRRARLSLSECIWDVHCT